MAVLVGLALPAQESAAAGDGAIVGRVLDAKQAPVSGAVVWVCDGETGVPLGERSRRPFVQSFMKGKKQEMDLVHALTDERGEYRFEVLPPGTYRLLAQSWRDVEEPEGLFEVNGRVVELRGFVNGVEVRDGATTKTEIRPLGTASLEIEVDVSNSWTVLVVSAWPTRADPVLGFAGWTGKFVPHALGANRMPDGRTTLIGLPAGKLFLGLFANDNNPGFGAAEVEVRAGKTTKLTVPIVASWSDGHKEPPLAGR